MQISRKTFFWMVSLLPALASAAGASQNGQIKINVSLTPAGSFVAESSEVKVRGETAKKGEEFTARDIVLDPNTLKTGIGLRDKHLREKYLESGKYPEAVLTKAKGKDGKFDGELQVHGVTKPIQGTYEVKDQSFVAKFKTKISDYKMGPASHLGVGAKDEVEVEITLPAQPQKNG